MITPLQLISTDRLPGAAQAFLKPQGDGRFGLFHDEMRSNGLDEPCRFLRADDPHPDVTDARRLFGASERVERPVGYAAAEALPELLYDAAMAHGNFYSEDVTDRGPSLRSDDGDATIGIEETSGVLGCHDEFLSAYDDMVANSVELRCPVRKDAEGQYRAKQGRGIAPGVCNEHVPPSKEKMCSALMGNHERAAEMTAPTMAGGYCSYQYPVKVRNNQGDRQCPTGRLYMINRSAVHFYVDPQMMFTWTEPRAWPNQLVKTRLLSLRCALVYKRRMYLGVIDGISA